MADRITCSSLPSWKCRRRRSRDCRRDEAQILSDLQTRLRELQREDLAGAAGLERVRRDMVEVVDRHIAPARVSGVLFTKFLLD